MVEYALILVLVSIVVIVILLTMGQQIANVFSNVGRCPGSLKYASPPEGRHRAAPRGAPAPGSNLEPPTGIEPVTCCLQNSCSAN
jgi:hypothetical protein